LNTIYLGRGAYGVAAAAKAYSQRSKQTDGGSECMLASVIRSHAHYDPSTARGGCAQDPLAYVPGRDGDRRQVSAADRAAQVFPTNPLKAKDSSR